MIQINTLVTYFNGLNLLIDPNEIKRPRGRAKTKVSANNKHVVPKPSNNCNTTCENVIVIMLYCKTWW